MGQIRKAQGRLSMGSFVRMRSRHILVWGPGGVRGGKVLRWSEVGGVRGSEVFRC